MRLCVDLGDPTALAVTAMLTTPQPRKPPDVHLTAYFAAAVI
ncbi:MAG TPA: hypothetical protein VLJ17_21290 [Xanthobacteraceae bacterium]|nr:hypothetical protein [Xanthobacteraceae bacterium]